MGLADITHRQRPGRWLVYLAGAIGVLQAGTMALSPQRAAEPAIEVPQLHVTLQTGALPAPHTAPQTPPREKTVMPEPTPPRAESPRPPVETDKAAARKIAPLEKEKASEEWSPKPPARPENVAPDAPTPALDAVRVARKPPPPVPAKPTRPAKKVPPKPISAATPLAPDSIEAPDDRDGAKTQAAAVVHEARYRRQTPPIYPRRSMDLGEQGVVTLHVAVLPSGMPREVKIKESSGYRRLDRAAMAAVKNWEFEPVYTTATQRVTWVRVPVRFVIRNN